ncbi:hypothetical protein [Aneurinibacillus danicus]|jgi:hypothetical protein|uniref:Uncharacterized protein n=1 Tax=Aneurinibacillus danicus TaxID=267746 RepID=A0A511VBY4_9BACL|nr:hypothetical protein [Aneurinibacillus danicus]GEN34742.1 hypothetical protein ADA01nite_22020 [Aneurinibacillus danicus]
MEVNMSMEEVLVQITQLQDNGESLSKKKVKQAYPQLMQSALYYFPSWEHAIQNCK